jgi:4'-phosphopantetheinyl transferase
MSNTPPAGLVWSLPPQVFDIRENAVHVWSIGPHDADSCLECCRDLLSLEERERAAKFKFERDRRRYIVAHGGLRSILASYSKMNAVDLQFSLGGNGKPYLEPTSVTPTFQFNLSHSHASALIAVTKNGEVGIDIEHIREDFAFDEVAERFFTSREVAALRALPSGLQRQAFYQCWTGKEAFLKAKGTGLSGALDEVEIVHTSEGAVRISGTLPNWKLVELSPADGYVGALATGGSVDEIKCFRSRGLTTPCPHRHS